MQVCSFGARGCRELRHYSGSGRRRVEPPHQRRLLRCDRSLPHHSHRRYCCRGLLLRRRLGGPHRRRRGPLCDLGPFPLLALHLGDWPAWARHLLRRAAAAAPRRSGGCFVLWRETPTHVSSKLNVRSLAVSRPTIRFSSSWQTVFQSAVQRASLHKDGRGFKSSRGGGPPVPRRN